MTAPKPDHLDEPRAQPDHEAMDDVGAYSETMPRNREPLEGGLWLPMEGAQ